MRRLGGKARIDVQKGDRRTCGQESLSPRNRLPTPSIASHFAKSAPLIAVGVQVITGVLAAKKQVSLAARLTCEEKKRLHYRPTPSVTVPSYFTPYEQGEKKKFASFSSCFVFVSIIFVSIIFVILKFCG